MVWCPSRSRVQLFQVKVVFGTQLVRRTCRNTQGRWARRRTPAWGPGADKATARCVGVTYQPLSVDLSLQHCQVSWVLGVSTHWYHLFVCSWRHCCCFLLNFVSPWCGYCQIIHVIVVAMRLLYWLAELVIGLAALYQLSNLALATVAYPIWLSSFLRMAEQHYQNSPDSPKIVSAVTCLLWALCALTLHATSVSHGSTKSKIQIMPE